jgi:predicted nucleic acid-binding protein
MRYLIDANALISLGLEEHAFHSRVESWLGSLQKGADELAVCAITELAFVRILAQLPGVEITVADAKRQLAEMKSRSPLRFVFLADDHGADRLPAWVKTAKQTTDGHLADLARTHGSVLATLDRKIPGAFVIPELRETRRPKQ